MAKISGNGLEKASYLFGTYHSHDRRAHFLADSVIPMLQNTDKLVVEIQAENKKISSSAISKQTFMKKNLIDLLSEEDYKYVDEKIVKKHGNNSGLFFKMKPFFTSGYLLETSSVMDEPFTLDQRIIEEAKMVSIPVIGLEKEKAAIKAVDKIPLEEQARILLKSLRQNDNQPDFEDAVLSTYYKQNLSGLLDIYLNEDKGSYFEQNIVIKRNLNWLKKIKKEFSKNSLFIAVGVMHLPGKHGLIELLKKEGYSLRPIISKYKIIQKDDLEMERLLAQKPKRREVLREMGKTLEWWTYENNSSLRGVVIDLEQFKTGGELEQEKIKNFFKEILFYPHWKGVHYPERYQFPIMPLNGEVNLGPGQNMLYKQLEMDGKNYFIGIIGNYKALQNATLFPLLNQIGN